MSSSQQTREKNLSSHSQKLPEHRSASDHITGVTIVILHAYHHPLIPAKCSSAPSIHCLDRHQSFKGISSSCFELYLLPPLNTAGESQDCAAVAENYLWWEICEGNECREKGKGKKTCKEIRDRKKKKVSSFKHLHNWLLWTQFVSFGHRSLVAKEKNK